MHLRYWKELLRITEGDDGRANETAFIRLDYCTIGLNVANNMLFANYTVSQIFVEKEKAHSASKYKNNHNYVTHGYTIVFFSDSNMQWI